MMVVKDPARHRVAPRNSGNAGQGKVKCEGMTMFSKGFCFTIVSIRERVFEI